MILFPFVLSHFRLLAIISIENKRMVSIALEVRQCAASSATSIQLHRSVQRMRWRRWCRSSFSKKWNSWIYFGFSYWNVCSSGDRRHMCDWWACCASIRLRLWNPTNWKIRNGMDITCDKFKVWFRIQFESGEKYEWSIRWWGQMDEHWSEIHKIRVQNKFINSCAITALGMQVNRPHCFPFSSRGRQVNNSSDKSSKYTTTTTTAAGAADSKNDYEWTWNRHASVIRRFMYSVEQFFLVLLSCRTTNCLDIEIVPDL